MYNITNTADYLGLYAKSVNKSLLYYRADALIKRDLVDRQEVFDFYKDFLDPDVYYGLKAHVGGVIQYETPTAAQFDAQSWFPYYGDLDDPSYYIYCCVINSDGVMFYENTARVRTEKMIDTENLNNLLDSIN